MTASLKGLAVAGTPNVPETDAEVEEVLRELEPDANVAHCLVGIYRAKRALGDTMHQAYLYVLERNLARFKEWDGKGQ